MNALGLVTNSIILWNTVYMEIALDAIRNGGYTVNHDDVKRLSPLGYDHINIVGHYSFDLPEEILDGKLRPCSQWIENYLVNKGLLIPVSVPLLHNPQEKQTSFHDT